LKKKKRLDTTATKIVFVKSKKIKNLDSVGFFVRSQGFDSQMLKKIWISKSKFWFRIFRKKFVNSKQLNVSTVVFDASGSIFFSLPDHLTSKSSDPAVPAAENATEPLTLNHKQMIVEAIHYALYEAETN
jgi:hypothetical protein